METYLFLDFDGVLNTTSFAKLLRKEGIDHYDEFGAKKKKKTISNLKYIVDHTGCKIVLSSTWRNEGWIKMQAPPFHMSSSTMKTSSSIVSRNTWFRPMKTMD